MRTIIASVSASCVLAASLAAAEQPVGASQAVSATTPAAVAAPAVWLGLVPVEVEDALAYHLGLKDDLGVMVDQVVPDSPAAKATIERFDVIVAIDNAPIYTPRSLVEAVSKHKVGEPVRVTVRRGAQSQDLIAVLAARPAQPPRRAMRGFDLSETLPEGAFQEMPDELRALLDQHRRASASSGVQRGRIVTPNGVVEWSTSPDVPMPEQR